MSKKISLFDDFTNLYELSKTLRFELKPVGETEKMLEDNDVFQKDEIIKKKYEATKPFFDKLHREFVSSALRDAQIGGLNDYFEIYTKWNGDRKNKEKIKELENVEKTLRIQMVELFNDQGNSWKREFDVVSFKKDGLEILFEVAVFNLLKERYGKDDDAVVKDDNGECVLDKDGNKISIFDSWNNFTGYFTKFFETRKNFYKEDGTASAIVTRIVDQNLRRFFDNIILFEKIKNKIDFSEVEKEQSVSVVEFFATDYYVHCLLQDDIDKYNDILGGYTKDSGEKIKGLNEVINNYRQNNSGEKVQFFNKLDKQILGEKDKGVFLDEIESDEELKEILKKFVQDIEKRARIFDKLIDKLVNNSGAFELDKIFLSKEAFNTISRKWTSQTHEFERMLYEAMKADKISGLTYDKKEDSYKFPDYIALEYVNNALNIIGVEEKFWKDSYYDENIIKLGINAWDQFLIILQNEINHLRNRLVKTEKGKEINIGLDVTLQEIKLFLENFELTAETKKVIKPFADDTLHYYQVAKYFAVEKKRVWNPINLELGDFYTDPNFGYGLFYEDAYEEIVKVYNKIRNYLTKKPFSEEKWKLNFENPTLAGGWDKNKESSYSTIILRKAGRYYLGIMAKGHNNLFAEKNKETYTGEGYEKMVYKFTKDVVTGIPKSSTQVIEVVEHFRISNKDFTLTRGTAVGDFVKPLRITKEIFDLNNKIFLKSDISESIYRWDLKNKKDEKDYVKSFQEGFVKLGGDLRFYEKSVETWINFCFDFLASYPSAMFFDYSGLKLATEYTTVSKCYEEMNECGYKIWFQNVSEKYVKENNNASKLYLFEIHNKDWNLKEGEVKTGTKNLHTLYFESLFSKENVANNFVMKLSGDAELFFRPKTSQEKLGHRIDKKGSEVVKNKRYSKDKMFLHLSIALNRGKGDIFAFNKRINTFLANSPDINVIGVDRGEKHLAYYSVVSQGGKILDSDSLNKVGGIDYYAKLSKRAKDREQARKDWQAVQDIKNLKNGYISQVVRKLADLAIEHNAIIVLEDLNMRFKQIRGGIEKSVYQQLEKALIDKLSFLVNKGEVDVNRAGHLLHAYQLCAPFESFQDMGKQTGILFYTQASYTSKIDPVTGWRPNLYLKKGSAEVNKKQIEKFKNIEYKNGRFEFTYNLSVFGNQKEEYPKKIEWTLCSSVERWRWDRVLNSNKGGYVHYEDLTDEFKKIFADFDIDINGNILEQINEIDDKDKKHAKLFSGFIFLWGLLCQIRNTDGKLDEKIKQLERDGKSNKVLEKEKYDADFILSPVEPFFDSRKASDFGENLPQNGDDNGAFNIARKGVVILDRLSQWKQELVNMDDDQVKKCYPDLFISHIDWDNFAQK